MSAYCDSDVIKATLTLTNTTFADDDIDAAIAAASDAINDYCNRVFDRDLDTEVTRIYTPQSTELCFIDDLVELATLETDQDGDGNHERTWTLGSEFVLDPANALADGQAYTQLCLNTYRASVPFPAWSPQSVKVTGKFGWPGGVPPKVTEAAQLLTNRLVKRVREAPFGVAGVSAMGEAVRIVRTDPDYANLLRRLVRTDFARA